MDEKIWMDPVRRTWANRVSELKLKGKRREHESAAYLQGVLAAATAIGAMTHARASLIAFFVMVGRAEGFLEVRED